MAEIAALGLRVDGVKDVDRASSSLDRLTSSSEKAEKSTGGLSSASKKSSQDVSVLADSSKQASSGVDGLAAVAKRAAGVMVSAFAGIKLTGLIKDAAMANSRFEQLGTVMEVVGRNVGLSSDQVNKYAKEVQGMGISMTESRQTVIRMAQAQMDLSKASELARLAQDAAVIANTNSSDALGRLIYGLQSGQVEILRTMGLNVNFANSYKKMADEANRSVDSLSEVDKAQARTNAVMEAAAQIAGAYEASMDSAGKQLGSTTRYVQDLGVMLGGVFSDATKQAVFGYSDALKGLHSAVTELSEDGSLEQWSKNVAIAMNVLSGLTAGLASYVIAVNGFTIAAKAAAAAQWLFNAAAMANPYVAAAAAVVALSVALYGLRNTTIGAGEDAATVGDYFVAAWDRIKQETGGLVDYFSAAWDEFKEETGGLVDAVSSSFSWLWEELKISAHVTINDTIGIIVSLDDTIMIVVKAMYEQFKSGFQNIAALAKAFGQGLAAVFRGDFGFDAFRKALTDKVGTPAKNTAGEIRDAWKKNLGKDWLGDAAAGVVEFGRDISETAKRSRKLQNDLDELIGSSGLFFGVMQAGGPVVSGTNDELKKVDGTLQSLVDKYDKLGAAQRTATAELAGLQKAAALGLPGAEEALAAFHKSLTEVDDALKGTTESVKENAAEADPFAQSWQAALERVDSAFVDLWKSAFNGFKDFADSLKNAFIQLLAELAHRATTQKILVSLGFTAGSGGAMAGGAGGGGAGMLGNLMNTGTWISAGKTLWQGFSGLATGQGLSGFAGLFGGHAANSALIPQHMLTRAASQQAAAITNFTNTVGPIIAGIAGAIQGWQTGNKLNAITGAAGGAYGMKGGAALGSYFGPIGTVVGGAIGAVLGSSLGSSVFGGGWENRRSGIQLGFDDDGLMLEDWIRQTKKGGLFGSTKRRYRYSEMEEAMADEFRTGYDTMIDVLGTQFLAIGVDLDRAVFEAVKIGSASINTSDQTEEEIQEQIEKWFNDLNAAMIQGALNAAGDTSAAVRLLRATGGDVAMLEALGGLMGVAGIDAVQQARDAQAQLSMVESYRAVTDATRTLIGEYDGSLEATLGLTEAMSIQQEMAFGLATAYLQASDAVGALFGNLKESIRTSLMGAEELYEYQRGQVHSLTDLLGTLTDPEAISRASQEIKRLVSGMWGGLDETQRVSLGDEFLDYLDRTEALAQDRLAQGLAELESTQSDIYSALTSQMNDVADRMIETADRMQAAADLQWQSSMQFGAYVQQMGGIMSGANQGMEQNA